MKKVIVITGMIVAIALVINVVAQQTQPSGQQQGTQQQTMQQNPQQPAPQVKVAPTLKNKANSPNPPSTAQNKTQKTSIGTGKATVSASQPSSSWVEQVDMDADGRPEETQFLYDAQRGVLYSSWNGSFTCQNGKTATGDVVEAVNAKGNKAGKPVGSGWYTVGLDEGKCGANKTAEYGCRFDASGNPTECGVATMNDTTGEIDIAVVQ
jgi:hypothetical protein